MGEKRSDMAPISRKDSSKSDFYATPGATGLSCILVCRACLGKTHYARDFMPDITMPPDGKDSITALRRDEGGVEVTRRRTRRACFFSM